MDAFNTQPRDNLGSILPMSQNHPLKEDLELLPKATHKSSVKLIGRLAVLAVGVSTFGLVSNEVSFYHFSSFYNFICTFTSLASLIISSLLIFWTSKTLNQEESNTETVPTRRWELFSQGLYTTLIFRAAISLPLIANMLFQGDNTSHHLRALEATYNDETVASTEFALRSIGTVLPFLEVLLSLIFVQAARTVFPFIREQSSTMTRMVFIGSAALMASSFGMLYALRYASDYQDLYNQPFPSWNIGGLVFFGITSAIIAGLVWTVNHTKWRAPYTIVAGVLAALTLGLAIFSSLSYTNSQSIAGYYGDMKNLDTWSEQMAATNKADLRTVGCPSKYLPKYIANDPSFDTLWGPGATTKDGLPTKYLNLACIELLGSQQASYFAEATTYGLLTVVSGLIILIGFLYFNHTQWREVGERNKKDYRWLVVLGAVVLAFNVAMIMYDAPLPSENAKLAINSNNYIYFADDATTATADATTATAADDSAAAAAAPADSTPAAPASSSGSTAPSTSITVSDRYQTAFSDLVNKNYRFMIFKHDSTIARQINIEAGLWDWTFLDFANAFYPGEEQVGFIMLGDEGKERPYMIVFAPEDTPAKDVLDGFGLPYNTQDYQRAGLTDATNYVVRSKKELDLNSILADSQSGIVAIFADDATTATADATTATATDDSAAAAAAAAPADAAPADSTPAAPVSSSGSTAPSTSITVSDRYQTAFNDLVNKDYRFMIFKHDPTIARQINIEAGLWDWTFLDFANAFYPGEEQVGFIMLGDEGKERPYMIVFAPEDTPAKDVLDGFGLPYNTQDYQRAGLTDATNYVVRSKKELDLNSILADSQSGIVAIFADDATTATADATPAAADATPPPAAPAPAAAAAATTTTPAAAQDTTHSPYQAAFNDLTSKKLRFIILYRDSTIPNKVNVVAGPWNWEFIDFSNAFFAVEHQVGFVMLGEEGKEQPYFIVYAPGGAPVQEILDEFDLPYTTNDLEAQGLTNVKYFVANTKKQLDEQNIYNQSESGTLVATDSTLILADDSTTTTADATPAAADATTTPAAPADTASTPAAAPAATADTSRSPYPAAFNDLTSKKLRFIILYRDSTIPNKINIVAGPWNWEFIDFSNAFFAVEHQVGFVMLGEEGKEQPYFIVYAPGGAPVKEILDEFDLPYTTDDLEAQGLTNVKYFVANTKKQLDEQNIFNQSESGTLVAADSTLILATSLNNVYNQTFQDLIKGRSRFVVFRHDVKDPMQINLTVGSPQAIFSDFASIFDAGREQAGIIYLGSGTSLRPYLVVLAPGNKNAANVLSGFNLPIYSSDYERLGFKNINYYVAKDRSNITLTNVVMNAKVGGTINLFQDAALALATDDNPFANIYNSINHKKYRYVVLKHDPTDPMNVKAVPGAWDSLFSDFNDTFTAGEEQVGIINLGPKGEESPYIIVFGPHNTTAAEILEGFGLPYTTQGFENAGLPGANYYVTDNLQDLELSKVVVGSKAGQITTLAEFEEGQWEPAEPAENGGDFDIFASSDANIYASLFQSLNNKDMRFAILRNDPNNPMNVKVAAAPWKWTFNDFVANINSTIDQVGFITLGPNGGEKPYMIVFTPSSTTTAKSVLNNLNLPTSTDDLQRAGLSGASYFVAHKVSDLDLNTIVMQSKAGSVGILFEDEEETDEEGSQQDQGDSEQSDENSGDYDNGNYENSNYEDSLTSTADDSTITGDASVFQETQNTPYAGIFNGLNNKKYRFVVLKHDPNDPMNVKITGGPWNLNFQNFTDSIDQNREQVAFVYLGPANQEKLYRVVVAPSVLNSNAGRVVDSFQLPRESKGLAQLGLKGVASYVAGSKSDIVDQKIITYSKASVA